ncbi:MAG: hypothetical protein MI863_29090 [Desulfobacterales bacterium]|nr:hypothetical protein [Desulfobacterales bacterium]
MAKESLVTMVWAGGGSFYDNTSDIVALSSVLPQKLKTFTADPFSSCCSPPDKTRVQAMNGKVILSFGGSEAGEAGWNDMKDDGVDAWYQALEKIFDKTGLQGIDWDLEELSTGSKVFDFVGQLSRKLLDKGRIITFTFFGNPENPAFPPQDFLEKYHDACSFAPIMLYNGGMWVPKTWGSWCDYAEKTKSRLSEGMQKKVLFGLYPKGGNIPCCGACVAKALAFVNEGFGSGIALWCADGWLGACTEGAGVVDALVKTIQAGKTSLDDLNAAYPDCEGATATNGCGE